ncbi:RNA-directed DNA polymerase from mobile element jockey [Araneus ventricosus]|uniref:RNA-directed DNA polymerase from mobile element jockey n=1 Tax=Araneus ventricosus TaxID=182803 RepID=A0A4Y2MXF0_ARAVE|nr:RNA-directed DNA polymerase from mobile element jockey [Araneus ventricosus]
MKNLYDLGFRGNLPIFVHNFLKQRFFRVRLGNTFSNIFCQEEGVPQGCVLSVTLFVLAINPILSVIPQTVQKNLYVDDLHISCYARNMQLIERQLQTAINNIVEWSNKSGFTISAQKTIGIHFCKRPLHPDPELVLSGVPIRFQDNYKFLGLVFDKRLTFLPHIASLRKTCLRSLNILRTLSNTSWGADRSCLLRVYRSIIRSMIDYGSVVYGSARPSYLKRLDYVHHQALRLSLGAFRTSPIPSLYAEAFEPSLSSRRDKLSLSYYFRILSNDKHPLRGTLLNGNNNRLFNARPSCIPHFGLRMRNIRPDTFHGVKVHTTDFCGHPPWMENSISYINPFGNFTKSDSNNSVLISLFNQHRQFYQSYQPVFTDGSKSLNHVGCAFFTNGHIICYKLLFYFCILIRNYGCLFCTQVH